MDPLKKHVPNNRDDAITFNHYILAIYGDRISDHAAVVVMPEPVQLAPSVLFYLLKLSAFRMCYNSVARGFPARDFITDFIAM